MPIQTTKPTTADMLACVARFADLQRCETGLPDMQLPDCRRAFLNVLGFDQPKGDGQFSPFGDRAKARVSHLQAGFDHTSGSQNSRITIAGYAWDADGFVCAIIMQKQGMPAALQKTACDLISQLLEPILTKVPYLPPNYSQFTPQTSSYKKGAALNPKVTPVYGGSVGKPSIHALLGGE